MRLNSRPILSSRALFLFVAGFPGKKLEIFRERGTIDAENAQMSNGKKLLNGGLTAQRMANTKRAKPHGSCQRGLFPLVQSGDGLQRSSAIFLKPVLSGSELIPRAPFCQEPKAGQLLNDIQRIAISEPLTGRLSKRTDYLLSRLP